MFTSVSVVICVILVAMITPIVHLIQFISSFVLTIDKILSFDKSNKIMFGFDMSVTVFPCLFLCNWMGNRVKSPSVRIIAPKLDCIAYHTELISATISTHTL